MARQDERISCLFLVNITQVLETVVWSLTVRASLLAQMVKNLPAMLETSLSPLQKAPATPSRVLAWRIPWTEEPGGAAVHGVAKSLT